MIRERDITPLVNWYLCVEMLRLDAQAFVSACAISLL
jgi:hypothetical protein